MKEKYLVTKNLGSITYMLHSDGHFYWNVWNMPNRQLKTYTSRKWAIKAAIRQGKNTNVVMMDEHTQGIRNAKTIFTY